MRAKEILINKIIQDQGIYPRFNTDTERVNLFSELLDCGTNLGPVKLVREGGFYMLLDGNHRLEAFRLKGRKKISAHIMQVEKRHWRLWAARFNNVSSKPLSRKELHKTICDAWEIDGIRDTLEIAHELGCSERYVRGVLQPLRQGEKEKLKKKVLELRKEGLSEREIARKIGQPKTTVHRVVQNGTVPFWTTPKTGGQPQNNDETLAKGNNITPEPEIPNTSHNTVDKTGSGGNAITSEVMDNRSNSTTASPSDTSDEPPSVIPELAKYGTWEPGQKDALRALELIRADQTVKEISAELHQTEVSIRNTAAALIALYQAQSPHHPYEGKPVDDIADGLGMKPQVVAFLDEFLTYMPGIFPTRKTVFYWLRKKENYPPYRTEDCPVGSLIDIMRYESIYWRCVNDKIKPPWEEEKNEVPKYEEVPREVVKGFQQATEFFRSVTDLAQTGALDLVMSEVMQRYNILLVVQNGFRDVLRGHAGAL